VSSLSLVDVQLYLEAEERSRRRRARNCFTLCRFPQALCEHHRRLRFLLAS
jgi:hypothetical protein